MTTSTETQTLFWNTVIKVFNEKLEKLSILAGGNLWSELTETTNQPTQDFTKLTDVFFQRSIKEAAILTQVDVHSACGKGFDIMYFGLRKEIKKTLFNENAVDKYGKKKTFNGWLGNVYQGQTKRENDGFILILFDIDRAANRVSRICILDVSRSAETFYNKMTEDAAKKLKSIGDKKTKGTAALNLNIPAVDYEHVGVILGGKTNLTPKGKKGKYTSPVMQDC